ncbi:hypothetical protein ACXN5S_19330 [Pseudoroseicyclus sp. H15]
MTSPAECVIRKCGGVAATARLCNRHPTRVSRWPKPRDVAGGGGGFIPSPVQQELLTNARANGIPLTPEDFFADPCPPLRVETSELADDDREEAA